MSDKNGSKKERAVGGYQPFEYGYKPKDSQKGHKATDQEYVTIPKAPKGGTGQSSGKEK